MVGGGPPSTEAYGDEERQGGTSASASSTQAVFIACELPAVANTTATQ